MKVEVKQVPFDSNDLLSKKKDGKSGGNFQSVLDAVQSSSPEQELDKYMKMTPEQRMRESILKQMGLTEDQLNSMPPDQKKAVEDKIASIMKQKMNEAQNKSGASGAAGIPL